MLSTSRWNFCALILAMVVWCPNQAKAELVTFDLGLNGPSSVNGADLIGFSSAMTSVSGSDFTVTMTAKTSNPGSIFRMNRNGLGVNSLGRDRAGQIDDRGGFTEGIDFAFSVSSPAVVTFVNIDLQAVAGLGTPGSDRGELEFSSGPTFNIDGTTAPGSADILTVNTSFSLSSVISLRHVDGNGFRLQAITLNVVTIPETSSGLMLASAVALTMFRRKRGLE